MAGKAKPKAGGASRAGKAGKSASAPKAVAKAKAPAKARKPAPAKKAAAPKTSAKTKASSEAKGATGKDAARLLDERLRSLGDWRGEMLAEVRRLIHEADPEVVEECKWVKPTNPWGVPVWSHAGILCTGEAYKGTVKLTFARGASLDDPRRLFNASLEGNARRAIDLREGDTLDAEAFKALVQEAVAANLRASALRSRGRGRT